MPSRLLLFWMLSAVGAIAQEPVVPLCTLEEVQSKQHLLPDVVVFQPGGAAQALSQFLGCDLVLNDAGTRSISQAASVSLQEPLVSIDRETLELISLLGPSPETDKFARKMDDTVFQSVAALSDRRAVLFLSEPLGAEIIIGGTPYGTTGQDMGVRDHFLHTARMVMSGYEDCGFDQATVVSSDSGRVTVTCQMVPAR